ncbi:MAG: aminotransferase [Candidatus Marinimicrobia bacterium]|nr:aminotransferase [Candidatus Neomarinimicrobiota bacterium]
MNNKILVNKIIKTISGVIKENSKELHEPSLPKKEFKHINKTLSKNNFMLGPYIQKFENKIKNLTKSKYVVLTNTGSSALHLSLRLIDVKKNDEILIPTLHYISSVNSTLYCGATPHFIDIDENSLGVDCIKLENYLKKISILRGKKCINKTSGKIIKAIIVLHVFGHSANLKHIQKICKKFKLIMIEDAAEAIGSYNKNQHLGTFGKIGILSFNGNKTISSAGGGAILTSDKKLAKKAKYLVSNAKIPHIWKYSYKEIGYNYRMPNINAAIGFLHMKYLKKILTEKRKLFHKYKKSFSKFNFIKILNEPNECKSNFWLQTLILGKNKGSLRYKLLKTGYDKKIKLRPAWELLHTLKHLRKYPRMNLDNAAKIHKRIINIPSSCYKIK